MGVIRTKNTRLMINLVMIQFRINASLIQATYNGFNAEGANRPLR